MTQPISPQEVNILHANSDNDSATTAQHHTLGTGHNQASPGDHKHDGKTSKTLATATLTGQLTPTTIAQVDAILDQVIVILKKFCDITDNRL